MENQHRKISGYRELTQQEIDLINKIKSTGIVLESLIREIQAHLTCHVGDDADFGPIFEPFRWVEMGKQNLQSGLMFLTRSVAQPESF